MEWTRLCTAFPGKPGLWDTCHTHQEDRPGSRSGNFCIPLVSDQDHNILQRYH